MLAQFFANVTPSEKLKCGWKNYYKEVNSEYEKFMNDAILQKKILDSIEKIDTLTLTPIQKAYIKKQELKVKKIDSLESEPIIVPELTSYFQGNIKAVVSKIFTRSNAKNIVLAHEYEYKGFSSLLEKDIDNSIKYFIQSENSYNSYHMVYEIANYLKENKAKLNSNPDYWDQVYMIILEKFNWKMPEKYKNEFKNKLK